MEKNIADNQNAKTGLTETQLEALIKEHGRNVLRFIIKKVRDPIEAEDLYQSTLCEAVRCRHTFMWNSQPQTWLCGIAFNLIRVYFARGDQFRYDFDTDDSLTNLPAEGADPLEITSRQQMTDAICGHLAALPDDMRATLTLVAEDDRTYDEAAEIMGIPVGTVRSRIFRARSYLKKYGSYDMLLS